VEERTLDELWERIEKEDPVLWAQMDEQKNFINGMESSEA